MEYELEDLLYNDVMHRRGYIDGTVMFSLTGQRQSHTELDEESDGLSSHGKEIEGGGIVAQNKHKEQVKKRLAQTKIQSMTSDENVNKLIRLTIK